MRLKLDSSPVCLWRRVLGKDASDAKGTKRQVSPGKPLTQNSEVRRQLLYEREPSRRECPEAFNSISRNAMINQMYVQFMKPPTTNARNEWPIVFMHGGGLSCARPTSSITPAKA